MDFAIGFLLVLYLVPWAVAEFYEHPNAYGVMALNIVTGWTGVGWVAALAWALTARPEKLKAPPPQVVDPAGVGSSGARSKRILWPAVGCVVVLPLVAFGVFGVGQALERVPMSASAELAVDRMDARAGPSAEWQSLGSLEAPCRVRLTERQGDWRRFWRVSDCEGSMSARAGWLPSHALVQTEPHES